MQITISDNVLTVTVKPDQYSYSVIYKCFYWYTGFYNLNIIQKPEVTEIQILLNKDQHTKENLLLLKQKISRDLIDFKLREIIDTETKTIRELIIAKAFAPNETEYFNDWNFRDNISSSPDKTNNQENNS